MDPALRRKITFSDHSLATDNVFSEVHLVTCRNVLIYFDHALQNRALQLFAEALISRGFLGLGSKESLRFSEAADLFTEFALHERIYRKKGLCMSRAIDLVVIGGSAGAIEVLHRVLAQLPARFAPAMAIVIHLRPTARTCSRRSLQRRPAPTMKLAEDKEPIVGGTIYFATARLPPAGGDRTHLRAVAWTSACIFRGPPSMCCSNPPPKPMARGSWASSCRVPMPTAPPG